LQIATLCHFDQFSSDGAQVAKISAKTLYFLGATGEAWMSDPNTVTAIVNALRQVHGDDLARVMLNDGFSLAILIDALLRSPLKNRDAVKLITRALASGDFIVTPDFGSPSHLKYYYDRPKSMHVVHSLATEAKRRLIEPETAPGVFFAT
jgi:hypothetical protein